MAYAEHDRYLQKFQMIKLSTPTFKRVLNAAPAEAIEEAGRSAGSSVPQSFILSRMGELTPPTVIEYLTLMGAYANLFDYSEISVGGKNSITLSHQLGPKGSLFLANYVDAIFRRAGKTVKITQFEDGITIEV